MFLDIFKKFCQEELKKKINKKKFNKKTKEKFFLLIKKFFLAIYSKSNLLEIYL